MSLFDAGVSALNAAQNALNIIGNNLANANTPGYHRQVVDLTETQPSQVGNLLIGNGVQIADVSRQIDTMLESALTNQTYSLADTSAQLNTLQQVQTSLSPSTGSLHDDIEQFFNDINQLAAQPSDTTQRTVVIGDARNLAQEFNALSGQLGQVQNGLDAQATATVSNVNSLTQQIAQLNSQIQNVTSRGQSPNDQLDQRDQLINQLAQAINVQVIPAGQGQVNVLAGGVPVVVGTQSTPLQYGLNSSNQGQLTLANSTSPINPTGGQLGGLLTVRNQALASVQTQLDTLAGTLAQQVDGIQATGLGLSGPTTFLSGTRGVSNVNVPLDKAGLAFPPQTGTLYVSVTDLATGTRTLTALNVDPTTQSLSDVANSLNGIPNLQAVTDAQTGTLQVLAKPGYAFDFAGRLPSAPDTTGYTGTATPQIGGQYTGTNNDNYVFKVVGSGTVGVTANLSLQVSDAKGNPIATLNVGQGYSPGTALTVANGVTVQLASGSVNSGDSFQTPVVAKPDTSGILTALGVGTFFTGSKASDLAVQSSLVSNPGLLAGSRTGDSGDNSNLTRLSALQNQPLMANGTQTLTQNFDALVGNVATQVQALTNQQTTQSALGQQLTAQQQNVSGVDPNEEMVNLMNFQRAFQVSSEYVTTVNTTLQSLLQIIH